MMYVMRTGMRNAHNRAYGGAGTASSASPAARAAASCVLELAHRLRAAGLPVSTGEELDAVAALTHLDLGRRPRVRSALRACLVKDHAHEDAFSRAFDAVFPRQRHSGPDDASAGERGAASHRTAATSGEDPTQALARALREGDDELLDELLDDAVERWAGTHDGRSAEHHTQRVLRRMDLPRLYQQVLDREGERTELERSAQTAQAAAALEQLRRRVEELVTGRLRDRRGADDPLEPADLEDAPLLTAGPEELAVLRAALRPLARRLATRLGSRRRRGRGGLDMRRTIRTSMGTGGVPVTPALRVRRPTRPDLVVLCDVSGSTAPFAPFTLTLLHAVHQEFSRVRSFVFVDGIVEITRFLETSPGVLDPRQLLDRRGLVVRDGRSDYTRVLQDFLATWGDAVTAKTTVIIAGDARSHDRPPALPQVAELAHRARRLYWLDPEPAREWDTGDSRLSMYAVHCTGVFEVATLRQLVAAVAAIA